MKKIYFKVACAICLITMVSFIACQKEFLEIQPKGQLSDQVLATKAGANKLLIGAYASLYGRGYLGYDWFFSDIASHEALWGFTWEPESDSFENHTGVPTYDIYDDKWSAFYYGVQRTNDVLRLLPLVPAVELSENEALQIKAEAMFLRGIFHFYLVKTWMNVPYLDETVTFSAGNYYVPNTTPVWPKIEADFQFAAENLADTKPDAGRANKWAAKAFLAKTYMYQHKYADALPLLIDCIDNGVTPKGEKYTLYANYFDNFDSNKEGGAETVFSIQYTVNDGTGSGQNGNWPYVMAQPMVPETAGGGCSAVTFDLVNTFKTDAVNGLPLLDTYNDFNITNDMGLQASDPFTPYTGTLDPRLDHTVSRRGIPMLDWGLFGVYWIWQQEQQGCYSYKKHFFYKADLDRNTQNAGWTTVNNTNIDVMRFADVLLFAAECEVEAGSLANAEAYINQVRSRAANPAGWQTTYVDDNDPSKGFTDTPAANYFIGLYTGQFTANGQAYARKAVHFERRLELAMEGHRFGDLQRWDNGTGSMADELNAIIDHELNHTPATFNPPNLQGVVFTKGKNEIYPIPQKQMDLSVVNGASVLIQNPGYN
jgi:starch-binding outer membrane protein, SusD/RagB family